MDRIHLKNRRETFGAIAAIHAQAMRFRECADSYWEWYQFEKGMNEATARLLGLNFRYYAFHGYTSMFRIDDLPLLDSDTSQLEKTIKDESALACERAHAASTLGHLLWRQSRREESLKMQRKGLKIAIDPTKRDIRLGWLPDPARGGLHSETTNGERFDLNQNDLKDAIDSMIKSSSQTARTVTPIDPNQIKEMKEQIIQRMMVSGGFPSQEAVMSMMAAMGIDMDGNIASRMQASNAPRARGAPVVIQHILPLGPHSPQGIREHLEAYEARSQRIVGASCDFCLKMAPEGGTSAASKLFAHCQMCHRVAYCSRECQVAHWKPEHKKSCRPPSDYKIGDLVRIQGLKSRPELNAQILEVRGPSPTAPDRFVCSIVGSSPTEGLGVRPENMHIIVPFEEREELRGECV